jgi:hypothetical protein
VVTRAIQRILLKATWIQFTTFIAVWLESILMLSFHLYLGLLSDRIPSGSPLLSSNHLTRKLEENNDLWRRVRLNIYFCS